MSAIVIPIPPIDLHFSDYVQLSLLLAVLYACTSVELLVGTLAKQRPTDESRIGLTRAATWAMLGIVSTLIAGVLAEWLRTGAGAGSSMTRSGSASQALEPFSAGDLTEYGCLIVPLFFVFQWGYFHIRGSQIVKIDEIVGQLDDIYERELLKYLAEVADSAMPARSAAQIFEAVAPRILPDQVLRTLDRSFLVGRLSMKLGMSDIAERLLFTGVRANELLAKLAREHKIEYDAQALRYRALGAQAEKRKLIL